MAERTQQIVRALRNNQILSRFVVEGRSSGRQLGTGSYGTVEEIDVNGLVCAGKKIHEVLIDADNDGVENIARKYVQECQLMSDLRHPNITQFLGVCFLPNCHLPVLVMERLTESLDDLLEAIPNIPLVLKQSMLENVARGLLYLHKHNPCIIHRDLTAKNVLLTDSLVAKITDFGNSRIVNMQPGHLARTLSRLPGTLVYMPPEALQASSRYGPSLDIFSFGHLALFIGLQVFPGDLLHHTYPDPDSTDRLIGRSEVHRRSEYLQQLEDLLPGRIRSMLVQLIKDCLRDAPSQRLTAEQLVTALEEMKANTEGPYGELAKADAVRQVLTMKALKQTKKDERTSKEEEIQKLETETARLQEAHQAQLEQHINTIQHLSALVREKDQEILLKESQLQQKNQELQKVNDDMNRLQTRLLRLQTELGVPLKLTWKKIKALPFPTWYYPQAVAIGERVFMGGGRASSPLERETLMIYHVQLDKWDTLPCGVMFFATAVWKNKLLLVGGRDVRTNKRIKTIKVLDETQDSASWSFPFPSMPDVRDGATAIVHDDQWVLVVGGYHDVEDGELSSVEILDTSLKQWHTSAPLPLPCGLLSAAVMDNTLMLLGGFSNFRASCRVLSADLDDLIKLSFHSHSTCTPTQSPWESMPNTPLLFSTALSLKGALLAVGGKDKGRDFAMKSIHLYHPDTKNWVKIGELPIERWQCACTVLPTGELFVAGNGDMVQKQVDVALMI